MDIRLVQHFFICGEPELKTLDFRTICEVKTSDFVKKYKDNQHLVIAIISCQNCKMHFLVCFSKTPLKTTFAK